MVNRWKEIRQLGLPRSPDSLGDERLLAALKAEFVFRGTFVQLSDKFILEGTLKPFGAKTAVLKPFEIAPVVVENGPGKLLPAMNNVARGRWSYPILSTPEGTRGPYSLHVTVEACEQAACCSPICSAPPNGSVALMPRTGRPCSARDVTACPSGECINGICDGGPLYGQACDFCPSGTCRLL